MLGSSLLSRGGCRHGHVTRDLTRYAINGEGNLNQCEVAVRINTYPFTLNEEIHED